MKFYRYESYQQGESFPITKLVVRELNLYRETEKGFWIGWSSTDLHEDGKPTGFLFSDRRWVSKTGRKRYAYPTKEEALESFIYRKKRQIKILNCTLDSAKDAYRLALEIKKNKS